ncbi:MAG TPA: SPOR domain-containing protein, partial [Gammaproteobacteria bacterium]|nr:SPOR domain-containing protein [Gammaproteobacteria bacterium]
SNGVPARINEAAIARLSSGETGTSPAAALLMSTAQRPAVLAGSAVVVVLALGLWLFWSGGSGKPRQETRELAVAPVQSDAGQEPDTNATGNATSPQDSQPMAGDTSAQDTTDNTNIAMNAEGPADAGVQEPASSETTSADGANAKGSGAMTGEADTAAGQRDETASAPAGSPVAGDEQAQPDQSEQTASPATEPSGEAGTSEQTEPGAAATSPDKPDNAAAADESADKTPSRNPDTGGQNPKESTPVNDWLAGRKGNHYTVQVLAARERATVERFLKRTDHDSRLHVITETRKNEPWRVVVMGDYPTIKEARQAIGTLPQAWGTKGAWPRTFASLRQ